MYKIRECEEEKIVENILTSKERNLILILFLLGIFMGSLDTGIIGPVLPSIQSMFHITTRESSWMYTFFVISFMVGSPVMAKFSDFYGRRKIYILDLLLFGLGSALIACTINIESIFLGRIIQGFGAGGIFPVAASFIGDYFPVEKRGMALGIIGSMFGVAAIVGPLVGAVLIPYGWQWCFTINVPISIFLIFFTLYILPNIGEKRKLSIDWLGIIILSLTAISLAYSVNQINSSHFITSLISIQVLPSLLIFIILLPILFKVEKHAKESVIPIHMFKNREISTACIIILCYGIITSITIFIPSLVIISLKYNMEMASLMLIPIVGTNAIAAPIVGKYLDSIGYKKIMSLGTLCLTIGCVILAIFPTNVYLFLFAEILMGFGLITLVGAPMRYLILTETTTGERGAGQALINMLSSVGQLIGGALIGGVIASYNGKLYGYTATLFLIAIFSLVSYLLTKRLKNRNQQIETMKTNK
jgi:MFS family permease